MRKEIMKGTIITSSERTLLSTLTLESGNHIIWVDRTINGLIKRGEE